MEKQTKHGFWYGFNLAAIILIVIFLLGIPLLYAFAEFIANVDLSLKQQGVAALFVPATFTLEVSNSEAASLNAVEFELSYDPTAILITSIEAHSTLCEDRFVITNKINQASGTALFQCGTITPFSGSEGTIATIHAIPLQSGTSTITFGENTHVLAHDGFGTDVTRTREGLTFRTN
jgi:hypothetical protein